MQPHLRTAQRLRLFPNGMPMPRRSLQMSASFRGSRRKHILHRAGLTLIEIMIALTITMIVLFAMAQAFQYASNEIADGRSILEMSSRLRNAQQLMRLDLASRTVQDVRTYTDRTPPGYFEYQEGGMSDTSNILLPTLADPQIDTTNAYLGDIDDVVAMTCRKVEGSYRGRFRDFAAAGAPTSTIESPLAEVIWFTNFNPPVSFDQSVTLYRRVLLIRPDRNRMITPPGIGGIGSTPDSVQGVLWTGDETSDNRALDRAINYFVSNDISARWINSDGEGGRDLIVANSLNDLARRENRFGRDSQVFPHRFDPIGIGQTRMGSIVNGVVNFSGDDILLTDVAAFDFRIYSPDAGGDLLDIDGDGTRETLISTTDSAYTGFNQAVIPTSAQGGFVDLGHFLDELDEEDDDYPAGIPTGVGSETVVPFTRGSIGGDPPRQPPAIFTTTPVLAGVPGAENYWSVLNDNNTPSDPSDDFTEYFRTYCTWSPHYESDGINQDGDGLTDEGTNGIDDDGINGVDDPGEFETAPPYPFRVRGVQVVFRIIEKDSRQLRQATVVKNFLQ